LSDTSKFGLSSPDTPLAGPSVIVPTVRFVLPGSKSKKRCFFDEDQNAVTPAPKQVWTSKNFYAVLAEVGSGRLIRSDVIVHSAEGTDHETSDTSAFQIFFPKLRRVPESVRTNKTRTKRLTKVIPSHPSITPEGAKVVVDWAAMDEFCAELQHAGEQAT